MQDGSTQQSQLKVLIAEDAYLLREGTRLLLQEYGFDVVGCASDYQDVLDQARHLRPDVVLMDIRMPPSFTIEGIRAAHVIRRQSPEVGVVILSQHDDESYVWELLKNGVAGLGYLNKIRVGDVDQIARALNEVATGGSVLDPRIVDRLLSMRSRKPGSPLSNLTPTELEVLRLMAEGKNNEHIRRALDVALGTVEKRAASVFAKLGLTEEKSLNRRVSAVLIYLRESGIA